MEAEAMPNDGYHGVAHHIAQNVDLAIVAAADPATLRAHARWLVCVAGLRH